MKNLIDKLVDKFNSEDIIKFSDKDIFKENKSWAITGSPDLELSMGIKGFPTGIVEIAGKSRSGKTTIGLEAMANFLRDNPDDGIAVILSSENRDNKDYALKLGIDPNKVLIIKIRYVEDMFMKVKSLINKTKDVFSESKLGEPKFFFMWDSLGATLSKAEIDTMEENTSNMEKKMTKGENLDKMKHEKLGAFAKPAKMFAKFLTGEMYHTTIHFIILNHVYDSMSGPVAGVKSNGGNWIEFMPCIRLRMALIGHEKIDEIEVAQRTEIKIIKNDFGGRRKVVVEILLGRGIVLSEDDIDYAVDKGIIKKESAKKFSFAKISWNSKRTFYSLYENHPKIMRALHKKIHNSVHKEVERIRYSTDENED